MKIRIFILIIILIIVPFVYAAPPVLPYFKEWSAKVYLCIFNILMFHYFILINSI